MGEKKNDSANTLLPVTGRYTTPLKRCGANWGRGKKCGYSFYLHSTLMANLISTGIPLLCIPPPLSASLIQKAQPYLTLESDSLSKDEDIDMGGAQCITAEEAEATTEARRQLKLASGITLGHGEKILD